MFDSFVRYATTTLKVLWWVTAVGTATTLGTLHGWQDYGWVGVLGFGLVGFGTGSAFAVVFPNFCLDLLGSFQVGLLRFLWETV